MHYAGIMRLTIHVNSSALLTAHTALKKPRSGVVSVWPVARLTASVIQRVKTVFEYLFLTASETVAKKSARYVGRVRTLKEIPMAIAPEYLPIVAPISADNTFQHLPDLTRMAERSLENAV